MIDFRAHGFLLVGLVILVALARPAAAFGAGNIASISKVEGQNWRHGDIEDALLSLAMAQAIKGGKKFNKRTVSRVYFGNWLRDYSQAIDVGTVKMVSAEAIRLLLCVLGFITFGYGSGEFEVTAERLGCYRPEDHIDNPKDYADNLDARDYDPRLRGPVDERVELAVDPESGMKNYIANERAGITTSAGHVRNLFGRCIELARQYKHRGTKDDLYEALRLMGTGLHCLEDFFAHSNYCELALIEMGERDVFPHCGSDTEIRLQGAHNTVYPIVTGTFGGVDFLHSVTGEVSDKLTQNEIDELEGTLTQSQTVDTSHLRDLLDKIPDGIFGDKNQGQKIDEIQANAAASQLQNMSVSPREPEEFTVYIGNLFQQIMPVIQFRDNIMKSITSALEKIPVLPKIVEQLEEQLSVFVFSIIAPFILPLIQQIKNELKTASEEVIASSEKEQHIVFHDDNCTNPTHSMLSKDHFSNILNEVAGRTAAKVLHWVVPQIMDAIDDDSVDIGRLLNRIIYGVLHHPAQREMGHDGASEARQLIFNSITEWWNDMGDDQREDYRRKLSRDGVYNGENHKEGVYDTGHGHGCSGKLKMRKLYGEPETMEDKIASVAATAIFESASGVISSLVEQNTGYRASSTRHDDEGGEDPSGGLFSAAAGSILGGAFNQGETERDVSYHEGGDGSYTRTETEYGRRGNRYGQAEYSETQHPDGGRESEYRRYEQEDSYGGRHTTGYGYEERTETQPTYGGYEQHTERREYGGSTEDNHGSGYEGRSHGHRRSDSNGSNRSNRSHHRSDDGEGHHNQHHRRHRKSDDEGEDEDGNNGGHGRRHEGSHGGGYGRDNEDNYGGGYGHRQERRFDDGQEEDESERRNEGDYDEDGQRREGRHGWGY